MRKNLLAKQLGLLVIIGIVLSSPMPGFADSEAVRFSAYPGSVNLDLNVGWTFRVDAPFLISSLGYYDVGGDGLRGNHSVGIFSLDSGQLLTSVDVSAGTSNPLFDGFRYAPITPFLLKPGLYSAMANNPGTDAFVGLVLGASADAKITYGFSVYSYGGAVLEAPTYVADSFGPGLFGPNFTIAPEPASWLLTCAGLAGLAGLVGSRRRQSSNAA